MSRGRAAPRRLDDYLTKMAPTNVDAERVPRFPARAFLFLIPSLVPSSSPYQSRPAHPADGDDHLIVVTCLAAVRADTPARVSSTVSTFLPHPRTIPQPPVSPSSTPINCMPYARLALSPRARIWRLITAASAALLPDPPSPSHLPGYGTRQAPRRSVCARHPQPRHDSQHSRQGRHGEGGHLFMKTFAVPSAPTPPPHPLLTRFASPRPRACQSRPTGVECTAVFERRGCGASCSRACAARVCLQASRARCPDGMPRALRLYAPPMPWIVACSCLPPVLLASTHRRTSPCPVRVGLSPPAPTFSSSAPARIPIAAVPTSVAISPALGPGCAVYTDCILLRSTSARFVVPMIQ
ncbi:hypothetical protein BKA93DRAFT_823012 [Sparassis latifolia]